MSLVINRISMDIVTHLTKHKGDVKKRLRNFGIKPGALAERRFWTLTDEIIVKLLISWIIYKSPTSVKYRIYIKIRETCELGEIVLIKKKKSIYEGSSENKRSVNSTIVPVEAWDLLQQFNISWTRKQYNGFLHGAPNQRSQKKASVSK